MRVEGTWRNDKRYGPQVRVASAEPVAPSGEAALGAYLRRVRHVGRARAEQLLRAPRRRRARGDRPRPAGRVPRGRAQPAAHPRGGALLGRAALHAARCTCCWRRTGSAGWCRGSRSNTRAAGTAWSASGRTTSPPCSGSGSRSPTRSPARSGDRPGRARTRPGGRRPRAGRGRARRLDMPARGRAHRGGAASCSASPPARRSWTRWPSTAGSCSSRAPTGDDLGLPPRDRRARGGAGRGGARARAAGARGCERPNGAPPATLDAGARAGATRCAPPSRSRLSIVTGGPGTGKTATIRMICAAAAAQDATVLLVAPTGRAARRMAESTGLEALDRPRGARLGARPGTDESTSCYADVLIVDETSMANLELLVTLLRAVGAAHARRARRRRRPARAGRRRQAVRRAGRGRRGARRRAHPHLPPGGREHDRARRARRPPGRRAVVRAPRTTSRRDLFLDRAGRPARRRSRRSSRS